MKKIAIVLSMMLILTLCLSGCSLISGGESAYELAVANGYEGTETEWLDSLKADTEYIYEESAYDLAVANGYEGTLEEWLASLKGDTGSVDVTITDSSTNTAYAVSKALSSSVSVVCYITGGYTTSGSGVVYQMEDDSSVSYIVTNYHVVYDGDETASTGFGPNSSTTVDYIADTIVVYPYGSSTAISATFAGGSIDEDIAILAVSTASLKSANMLAVTVGSSVTTGESIYVVGNAEGEGISATSGIVSVYRTDLSIAAIDDDSSTNTMSCIQIDAAVNHGNSGGGLFDSEGNWIGVVNAKVVSEDVEGMGYAIPVSIAQPLTEKIISAYESAGSSSAVSATRYLIGVSTLGVSSTLMYDDNGLAYVAYTVVVCESYSNNRYSGGVTSGGLADEAGVATGDILLSATLTSSLYGADITVQITDYYTLSELMLWAEIGDTLTLTVERNSEEKTFVMTITDSTLSAIVY